MVQTKLFQAKTEMRTYTGGREGGNRNREIGTDRYTRMCKLESLWKPPHSTGSSLCDDWRTGDVERGMGGSRGKGDLWILTADPCG